MGTQNSGYSKFVRTFISFETTFFLKFWADKICGLQICWYPKHVGTQKYGYNEISNFVGTQNW